MKQHSRKLSVGSRQALLLLSMKYELKEVIGKGVEGSVLKAEEIKTGKNVAVKHIKLNKVHYYVLKKLVREI